MAEPRDQLAQRRRVAGFSQESLAEELQVDRTTVGRWETGVSLPKAVVRPRLARILGLSLDELNGLLHTTEATGTDSADDDIDGQPNQYEEGEDMHRRQFLALAGHAFAALVLDPAAAIAEVTTSADGLAPPSLVELTRAVDEVKRAFQDCEYDQVVDLVPAALGQLRAAEALSPENERQQIAGLQAHTYHVAASVLLKLHALTEAQAVAEKAMLQARKSEDPVAIGAASRIVTHTLMTQGTDGEAKDFAQTQAIALDAAISRHSPDSISIYGSLLLRGAVAAAQTEDADTARTLLDEADRAAHELGGDFNYQWTAFGPNNVIAHRIAIEVILGNAGAAVDNYNLIRLDKMAVTERKARVHVDLAKAYTQWGKYDLAYDALREAEAIAPQELRRPEVKAMIRRIDILAPHRIRRDLAELNLRVATE